MSKEHEEQQYLNLIRTILEKGNRKNDRTGTGTLSICGSMSRYSLENNKLPLLTTKTINIRIVIEELLFFLKGETDNKILKKKGIKIWNLNSTKEFLENRGINREEDDLGPVYGFQWRHFGAEYSTCTEDYTKKGIDQLSNVIEELKKDKNSRRLVVSAWNPIDLDQMVLPPCHVLFQFLVQNDKLNCILYQRSGDVGLGVPFNIASYSVLLKIVSYLTNIPEGEFIHFIGDAHIYTDHIDQLTQQCTREPREFPTLKILPAQKRTKLEEFIIDDFILEDYHPHPPIKMNMSA
ncbi:thymidylate synthase [Nematocida sp. AWRm80]|nr:thymidylate synthase [Nematocida sp. AWRm80]